MEYLTVCTVLLLVGTSLASPVPSAVDEKVKCGVPAIKPDVGMIKIVGGRDAVPYSWPWQVALFESYYSEPFQFCGGTLISNEWVMTAGHCFYGEEELTQFTLRMGVYDKNKANESGEIVIGISEIHVHPEYDSRTTHFDITLLKLERPINFTDHISPICLPSTQDEPLPTDGSRLFVTGWGDTTEGGSDSATLKQVSVPLSNTTVCKDHYDEIGYTVYEDTMFCAGLDEGGKDSCQGDSGGPVVYQNPKNGAWTQIGIVSWGLGCAEPYYYGVYSKVSAYVDFIKQCVDDL